jgi:hypothetical protein
VQRVLATLGLPKWVWSRERQKDTMKRILFVCVAALLVLLVCAEAQASGERVDTIAFQMRLDKSQYLIGENVWLHLFIVNLTNDTLHTISPDYDALFTVDLHVIDQSGKELLNTIGFLNRRRICQHDLLLPHDTLLGILELTYSFDQRPLPDVRLILGQLPGSYTIDATYLDRMAAPAVSYSVIEPIGEEAEAFALYRAVAEASYSRNSAELVSRAEQLLGSHPQSVYAPQALQRLSLTYLYGQPHDDSKYIACYKRIIADFPNSAWCQYAFGRIIAEQSLDENRAYFQSILSSKSGTWAARIAKNLLTRPWLAKSSKGGRQPRLK